MAERAAIRGARKSLVRLLSGCLAALLCVFGTAVQSAGTGPHRWVIGGNIGACGSAVLLVENDFATLDNAVAAVNQAWAAFPGCNLQVNRIEGTFPNFTAVGLSPEPSAWAFIGAICRAHVGYAILPTGGCNATNLSDPEKGSGCAGCKQGNPVDVGNGNKSLEHLDYVGSGPFALRFARTFNSISVRGIAVGTRWTHSYQRRIVFEPFAPGVATAYRADGQALAFRSADGQNFAADVDVASRLTQLRDPGGQISGWSFYDAASEQTESYDAGGKLLSVASREGLVQTLVYSDGTGDSETGGVVEGTATPLPAGRLIKVSDPLARSLRFGYDATNRIARMTIPDGGNYLYGYDSRNNPVSVTYPDTRILTYHHGESELVSGNGGPYLTVLTGITDENGDRFASYSYASDLRPSKTVHFAGGAEVNKYEFVHSREYEINTVTDPFGQIRTFNNIQPHGRGILTSITGPACPSCGPAFITRDANGNAASRTDWNGNRTNYTYDLARNLETSRTEGLTSTGGVTPQTRTISTVWHASFRLPAQIAEPLRLTTNVYDADGTLCGARGALCSRTIQATTDANGSQGLSATPTGAPRTWTYTYNANGSVLAVNGPRTDLTDLTTYGYYPNDDPDPGKRGNLATITNAAGHATQISAYNAHGQPVTIVDPNGLVTTLSYDARQRLASRNVGGEVTSYQYDGVGQLTRVTLPDGSFLAYSYDSAHRLTGLSDNLGNRIAYTLDAMGNRTREDALDPASALAQTRSRVYSNLNRLFQEIGAATQVTEYGYDNQGNVTSIRDPLARITSNQYDALNRLRQVTDPATGVTQYGYNGLDALTQVSEPRGLVTGYTVDGLGNLTLQSSPDTGTTASTYDAAGNLLTQTDAKGQTTAYVYDALNRVTLITFADGSRHTFGYDAGANAIGRLNSITELSPANQMTASIAYGYDQRGRVVSETRTVNGVAYATAYSYDSAGRLATIAYPSGRTVNYGFDALGRVSQVTSAKDGQTQVVVQNVAYHPFGGAKGWTLGNGQAYIRGFDQDGRIASYSLAAQTFALGYDAASRIAFVADLGTPANSNTYSYDSLDRLTNAVAPGTPYAYSYDAVGNRLTKTVGVATDSYIYGATSNRIASITPATGPLRNFVFDANGSTTSDAVNQYNYDARGRLVQAVSAVGASAYQVNALGQRIRKSNALGDSVFHYDTQGRLIAETDPAGALRREVIYLGDIPVAVVR